MSLKEAVKKEIRNIPDFPKGGINFKDITPLFQKPDLLNKMVAELKNKYQDQGIEGVAGIESRGFLLGVPLAMALEVPFILIRKKGKLPYKTVSYQYDLEYGTAEIEMHIDSVKKGQNILIHDDLLATGGSASAAAELISSQGGIVQGFHFLIDLSFLNGQKMISKYSKNISSFVTY